jgi:glucose/mannose-6-phosphate isomerase
MLDDLKMIHERDTQDSLGVAAKQWQQLNHRYETGFKPEKPIKNIIVAGMGGSALAAEIINSWPGLNKPFQIVKNYELPEYAGEDTLFIASSYSGNTEETLAALSLAESKGATVVIICSGGKLADIAKDKGYAHYQIPAGLQPRMAVFYNFAALVQLFVSAGFVSEDKLAEMEEAADWLGEQVRELLPEVPTDRNLAKKTALELVGNSAVIYSGPKTFPAAYKWKININENAKSIAWCNQLPEFNHNEIVGWTSHPIEKPYKVIDIRSNLEHPRVQARFEITERLLSGKRPHPQIIIPEGDSLLKQLLWVIQVGDFTSLYLALLNGINPTPVEIIEKLKEELKKV